MKAECLKIVKSVEQFMKEYFPEYGNYKLSSAEVSKSKNLEKGDISINVDVKRDNVPKILDTENYSTVMKKKMEEILNKEIRWFSICWDYHTDPESVMTFNICFKIV